MRAQLAGAVVLIAGTWAAPALAGPWLAPGDAAIRHDLQLLADEGILHGPLTTWPVSWPDIARELARRRDTEVSDPGVAAALSRIESQVRLVSRSGVTPVRVGAAIAERPTWLRSFDSTPREEGELEVAGEWLGDRFSAGLRVTGVADADDGHAVRLDGSWLGVNVANLMISAGAMDRWWGPGWEGSLILSGNARPIPALAVERNASTPFRSPLLRWIGPWRATLLIGQLEGSEVAVPDAAFFAARVTFRPRDWLEIGLSRSAQACGQGRPCDLETFGDLLVGRDNRDAALPEAREPGNQMAGYDVRVRSPWRALPVALYAQLIGEDEAGSLPSKFLGLFGAEAWGSTRLGSYRVHFEYADTTCNFSRQQPQFDCAYRNALYPQGYTHRGRAIGHALDGDGRLVSLGALLARPAGSWQATLSWAEVNRGGAEPEAVHTVASGGEDRKNVELQYNRAFARGELGLGLGLERHDGRLHEGTALRGFVQWRQGF